ncbi:hypothetical protein AJ87_14705 [Rhizobium yanglingense]|nr:hypothetical protein AJ87_14705 [Rhizobium yanglingense]
MGVLCAKMGDGLYELVLLCTAANLLLPVETVPETRRVAAQAALSAMKDGLREVAAVLKNLPLADPNPSGQVCGLPFSVAPIDVAPTIDAVLDRATEVITDLYTIANQIEQNATNQSATFVAQGIVIILDEDISPALQSLRP